MNSPRSRYYTPADRAFSGRVPQGCAAFQIAMWFALRKPNTVTAL